MRPGDAFILVGRGFCRVFGLRFYPARLDAGIVSAGVFLSRGRRGGWIFVLDLVKVRLFVSKGPA